MRLLVLIMVPLLASAQSLSVGAGPYLQTQPYPKADPLVLPSPVIFLEYGVLYVRWSRLGVYFAGGEQWGASLMLQPRTFGYEANDAPMLEGMHQRKRTWEGGLSLAAKNDDGFIELCYLHDLLNSTERSLARLEAGNTYTYGAWSVTLTAMLLLFSAPYNDYYYGVRPSEARDGREAYKANDGINVAVQSYVSYTLSKEYSLLLNLRADLLSPTITRSPIVDDALIYSGMISLLYHLEW
ncbi:MAG: MipA/OmpV family protein [Campylobacterales bacterium]|nr:MipA/OmpV family protein [Campylobacterales bacterium]